MPANRIDRFPRRMAYPGPTRMLRGLLAADAEAERRGSVDPWQRGAYSYYRVGQYTSIAGIEQVPERRLHFAGEHTEVNQQGFLEGAVVSGQRAAREILSRV